MLVPCHRFLLIAGLLTGACFGCQDKKSGGGSSSGGSGGAQAANTEPPHEIKDHAESATFRMQTMSSVIGSNYETRVEEYAEARDWLKNDRNRPAKVPRALLEQLVADFYAAGAEKVYVSGLVTGDEGSRSDGLVVLISPTEHEPRNRVLEVRNKHYASYLPTVGKPELVESLSRSEASLAAVIVELKY
ncbi:MAG: hypothetical protein C0483_22660 [Pirellula sp.]|nr:hypothetical protein [Pirellula sp.]